MTTNKRQWAVIGRGKCGWHAEAATGLCSSSGGAFDSYLSEAIDGALVYDADGADYDTFASLVISGPMCKPSQGDERPYDPAKKWGYGSFCYVSVETYERLLRRIDDVKIGHVKGGVVEWVELEPFCEALEMTQEALIND